MPKRYCVYNYHCCNNKTFVYDKFQKLQIIITYTLAGPSKMCTRTPPLSVKNARILLLHT